MPNAFPKSLAAKRTPNSTPKKLLEKVSSKKSLFSYGKKGFTKNKKVIYKMAKTYLSTVKYMIKTSFTIEGIVDKHDIIGAIFGQSEGLIGEEMDLKELQKNGKLGRIEVEAEAKNGKTVGTLTVPSSLDRVQTTILAAAIETVDKVGPCNSTFQTQTIEDARQEKRKVVTERARELLMKMGLEMPETQEIAEEIREKTRTADLREIGIDKIPIGPEVDSNEELVLVEGRADVINLLKHGIKNVAGVGGAKASRTVANLAKNKKVTLFVDGDRGGDIIARQLSQAIKVDFIAKAPDGKEVEELTLKEILSALRKKNETATALQFSGNSFERPQRNFGERAPKSFGYPKRQGFRDSFRREGPRGFGRGGDRPFERDPQGGFGRSQGKPFERGPRPGRFEPKQGYGSEGFEEKREMPFKQNDLGQFNETMKQLEGSLKARIIDDQNKVLQEIDVRELLREMERFQGANAIVLDGIITKRLLQAAEKTGIKQLIGVKKGKIEESAQVKVQTLY